MIPNKDKWKEFWKDHPDMWGKYNINQTDNFIQQAKEFDKQINELKNICEQYNVDYEQKKEDAKYLAQTTTMSNEEALYYVTDNTIKDELNKLVINRTPENTGNAFKNIMNKIKGEYDMFDVNKVRIGDYVQMVENGEIGYVYDIKDYIFHICLPSCEDYTFDYTITKTNPCSRIEFEYVAKQIFKQIGTYKFDEKEKQDKIEKLVDIRDGFSPSKELFQKVIVRKINEIIDYLNKE